jgi:hypothetical protein
MVNCEVCGIESHKAKIMYPVKNPDGTNKAWYCHRHHPDLESVPKDVRFISERISEARSEIK